MPEISAISDADRVILTDSTAKALRARVAAFAVPLALQVKTLHGRVPSYMFDAASALVLALDRWEADEKAVAHAR